MSAWPLHFPLQCPPSNSIALVCNVYRFTNRRTPCDADFLSHYERKPDTDWKDPCQARGLSVLRTIADCLTMQDGVPALRKKCIAVATISVSVGVIVKTPSQTSSEHHTWWRSAPVATVLPLFASLNNIPKVQP